MEWARDWLAGEVIHSRLDLLDRLVQSILMHLGRDYRVLWTEDDWKQVQSGHFQIILMYLDDAISLTYEGSGKADNIVLYARNYVHWHGKLQYTVSFTRPAAALMDHKAAIQLVSLLQYRVFSPVHPLAELPVNCLATVLAYLSPTDSNRLSVSSYSLYITLQSQSLWQLAYIFRFGDPMFSLNTVNWRIAYSHQARIPS